MEIVAAYPFRVTRNTDMEIQEEEADDLLMTMEENLRQRVITSYSIHYTKLYELPFPKAKLA